jgi:type 1 glutamine amidotransferase
MVLLAKLLLPVVGVLTIVVLADGAWERGPELLDGADAAVLFVSEGAKWIHADPERLAAFRRLAGRGGGLVCWHWGMGCKDAEYVDGFVNLFGGCHGGPDRRYKVLTVTATPVDVSHPVLHGVGPVQVHEEFYYRLKRPKEGPPVTPLVQVEIDGRPHTVGWAWQRPGGGRSFGFSGGHFHENWKHPEYRRLAVQGVLWTLHRPIPERGQPVEVTDADLKLKPRQSAK